MRRWPQASGARDLGATGFGTRASGHRVRAPDLVQWGSAPRGADRRGRRHPGAGSAARPRMGCRGRALTLAGDGQLAFRRPHRIGRTAGRGPLAGGRRHPDGRPDRGAGRPHEDVDAQPQGGRARRGAACQMQTLGCTGQPAPGRCCPPDPMSRWAGPGCAVSRARAGGPGPLGLDRPCGTWLACGPEKARTPRRRRPQARHPGGTAAPGWSARPARPASRAPPHEDAGAQPHGGPGTPGGRRPAGGRLWALRRPDRAGAGAAAPVPMGRPWGGAGWAVSRARAGGPGPRGRRGCG